MVDAPVQISIVTPVYHGSKCVSELYRRLVAVLERLVERFEIIMVNDASPDDSWQEMVQLASGDKRVKAVDLSRNFGQHFAITAGMDLAHGDWVVVMDCDLQDQPEEIERLYRKALEGYDIVYARRTERQDTWFKKFSSRAFNFVYNLLSDRTIDSSIGNFSIISREVADSFRTLRERNRSYGLFLTWLGFQSTSIDVQHAPRFAGKTGYSFRKSIWFAIESITSQSNKPLRLSIDLGFLMALFAFAYAAYRIVQYMIFGVPVPGWTSVIVSLYFLGGLLLANLGIVGLYLGKVFDETKNRPLYVIKRAMNLQVSDTMKADHPSTLSNTLN